MSKRRSASLLFPPLLCQALLFISLGCGFSKTSSFNPTHPPTPAGRSDCGSCHGTGSVPGTNKPYTAFNHDSDFLSNHARASSQNTWVCTSCHAPSMCADCHAGNPGLNPAKKLAHRPDRIMPHRGNYLVKHKFDGKLDPSGCYMCHGRGYNAKCLPCHQPSRGR